MHIIQNKLINEINNIENKLEKIDNKNTVIKNIINYLNNIKKELISNLNYIDKNQINCSSDEINFIDEKIHELKIIFSTHENENKKIDQNENNNGEVFDISLTNDKLYNDLSKNLDTILNSINFIIKKYKEKDYDVYDLDEPEEKLEEKLEEKTGGNIFEIVSLATFSFTCVFIAIIIIVLLYLINDMYKLYKQKKIKKAAYRMKRKMKKANKKFKTFYKLNAIYNTDNKMIKFLNKFEHNNVMDKNIYNYLDISESSSSNSSSSESSSDEEHNRIDVPKFKNKNHEYEIYNLGYKNHLNNLGLYSNYNNEPPINEYYNSKFNNYH